MQLLTLDNTAYLLDRVPDHVAEDMRFAVLDNSDPSNPDFFFIPLIYLESFSAPSAVLQIGDNKIQMPLDWHILLGDPECGDLEIVPLTSLNDRSFHAFCFNPITDSMPSYQEVRIINIYNEVEWFFPRTKSNQLISVPIQTITQPLCAYFIKEINRNTDTVLLDNLFHA
jgi:hypothetical protein|tara:strand:- start:129 stop:638 length:510 start_codon:yes stop_codon:yes gene_type:complete